ncbi:MAG: UDP-2,3-diacylglucosamine diphosphatase [Legionella sp.]|nr:UDP-2,3-diacylglucosamine diphosphatase [Legionella sp.]
MNDLVFISDLHLHPKDKDLQSKFDAFIEWAKISTKKVYILGDFFHVWVGDDAIDDWSHGIANQLQSLKSVGVCVFFMPGNRDFLLNQTFAKLAGWEVLREPTHLKLGGEDVLLMHGDGYCTLDKNHQRFRKLTRNPVFTWMFSCLPLSYRIGLANKVRKLSMAQTKPPEQMDVVASTVVNHMFHEKVSLLIHGHTHKPGISHYSFKNINMRRYVLSDWDDKPQILSYNSSKGLYFDFL